MTSSGRRGFMKRRLAKLICLDWQEVSCRNVWLHTSLSAGDGGHGAQASAGSRKALSPDIDL